MRHILTISGFAFAGIFGMFIALLMIFSLPLATIAIIRFTEWEWWWALITASLIGLIPLGQIVYIIAALLGVYYFVSSDFSWQAATQASWVKISHSNLGETRNLEVAQLNEQQLFTFKRQILLPQLRRHCNLNAREISSMEGESISRINKFCECYSKVISRNLTLDEINYQKINGMPSTSFHEQATPSIERCRLRAF